MTDSGPAATTTVPAETAAFYRHALRTLEAAEVPFLVGGAYAFARYTGIERHTKDFDVFVRRRDRPRLLRALAGAGCRTAVPFPHWLAKAMPLLRQTFPDQPPFRLLELSLGD